MPIDISRISDSQAERIVKVEEGRFSDIKSLDISPANLTKTVSAFANTDGGDLYVGISEIGRLKLRKWEGFHDQEGANGHLQIFDKLFPLGTDFLYEFLRCDRLPGLVLHIQVNKTHAILPASNGLPYIRRGAQNLPVDSKDSLRRLEYSKGIASFETELTNAPLATITESDVMTSFIKDIVPTSAPEPWLRKQALIRESRPTVAGVLLFADEPQALIPKRCGIKIARYKTRESTGFREALDFTPITVEGSVYQQIMQAVARTTEIIESIPSMGEDTLESIKYPPTALHEIITNAVLHRDYSTADDVHITIFDNRVEVLSPGKLPAHITVDNILNERFARNGALVRVLNKFPDPPNKDIGEGLNAAFDAMHQLGLKEPVISERDNSVLVIIRHEPLASPQEAIMDYLETHATINNGEARRVTHVRPGLFNADQISLYARM
jgi:ATP-dependent DNA helicase RecG